MVEILDEIFGVFKLAISFNYLAPWVAAPGEL